MNTVVDRVVQYPHRYQLKNVNTGEVLGTFDLEPITGTISVVGTKIDKALFDSIATDIGSRLISNGGDAKDNIITYTMASDRNNIVSGEKLSVSFGKIAKYINDLKAVAFSGNKKDIGLGNVDNTSDKDKPISTAQQQGLNKPLYNLGAFDTISGNVITRQTGYIVLDGVKHKFVEKSATRANGLYYCTDIKGYVENPSSNVIVGNIICNILRTYSFVNLYDYNVYGISLYNTGSIGVGLTTDIDTLDKANAYLVQNPISIQYKLATSYPEEIIEGQPLITLDQNGSNWLRSEWEKGLNLFGINYPKTLSGDGYLAQNISFVLNVGTYTIKVSSDNNNGAYAFAGIDSNNFQYEFGSASVGNSITFTVTNKISKCTLYLNSANNNIKVMLNEGDHAYPYQPYNSKAHITNYEADFLKEESLKSANLCNASLFVDNKRFNSYGVIVSASGYKATEEYISIKPNTTYTITNGTVYGYKSDKTFDNFIYNKTFITKSTMSYIRIESKIGNNVMLNEGTEPLPYQEYNGSIVREKQLNELDNKKANNSDLSRVAKSGSYNDLSDKPTIPTVNYPVTSVNNKTGAVNLTASDVGARPSDWTPSKADVGLGSVDNTSDSEKEVASAKVLKNNDVSSFTLSAGVIEGINFADNSVYLIYNDHWVFIMRIGDKNKYFYTQSTVCYNEGSSRPLWFIYDNTNGFRLSLKTTKTVSNNEYVTFYDTNETFNYKLLSTD